MKNWKIGTRFFLVALLAASLGLGGCSGDDGSAGAAGAPGAPGAPGVDGTNGLPATAITDVSVVTPTTLTTTITGVTINSPPQVTFRVAADNNTGAIGLTSSRLRFIIAKLVPGTNGAPDSWQSYVNRTETPTAGVGPGGSPALASAIQATTESNGTLVDNGDGSYTYTFATDVANVTTPLAVSYEPTLTHRVAIQLSGGGLPVSNAVFDFVPAGGAITVAREIAMTTSCNECHGNLAIHGGGRVEMKYCVTCHNPGSTDANSGNTLDMAPMVHKIHMGSYLPSVQAGGKYSIWGFGNTEHDYSGVIFPMNSFSTPEGLMNCRKCHSGADAATPQGDNWMDRPSRAACGSCHDAVDFAAGVGHSAQADDRLCASCHDNTANPVHTEVVHRTVRSTENNPEVPAFARIFRYEVASWSMIDDPGNPTATPAIAPVANRKVATVKFRVLAKQKSADPFVPVNLTVGVNAQNEGLDNVNASAQNLSFRLIWAAPQAAPVSTFDGPAINAPKDWNNNNGGTRSYFVQAQNTGRVARDQPLSGVIVSGPGSNTAINLGTLTPDADGWYTATVNFNLTAAGYAAVNSASMRALGVEGAFTPKTLPTTGPYRAGGALNLTSGMRMMGESLLVGEGKSAIDGVITDTARRKVVAEANCNACHEWFGFHGSQSRNNNFDYCTTCHNPEITNSGRGTLNGVSYNGEFSNNLKDLVHGIHAADKRTVPLKFARGNITLTGGNGAFDFSHVDAFGRGKDCLACHSTGTFMPEAVPAGALWSTLVANVSPGMVPFPNGAVLANGQEQTPVAFDNTLNLRMAPISAACYACHDSVTSSNHMAANIANNRGAITETCVTCHGAGRSADVDVVHGN